MRIFGFMQEFTLNFLLFTIQSSIFSPQSTKIETNVQLFTNHRHLVGETLVSYSISKLYGSIS